MAKVIVLNVKFYALFYIFLVYNVSLIVAIGRISLL